MGAVNTTYTFTATDTITSTKMNNIIDETVMTADAVLNEGGLVVASGKLAIGSGVINSSRLAAGAVSNTNVSDTAAIAGTKISPNFGSQNIVTTGTLDVGTTSLGGTFLKRANTSIEGGDLTFAKAIDNTTGFTIDCYGSTSSPDLRFIAGASVAATLTTSGNLGIGTTVPDYKLHVSNGNAAVISTSSNAYVYVGEGTGANQYGYLAWDQTNNTLNIGTQNNPITFGTDSSEWMRISTGKVGIGTSTPQTKLSVTGPSQASNGSGTEGIFQITTGTGASTDNKLQFGIVNGNYAWIQSIDPGAANRDLILNGAGGNVGIGTSSPSFRLQLSTDSAAKPSTTTWTISSDERLKENIELANLDICYDAVKNIPLKRYKWKDEIYSEEQVSDRSKIGWIAQDVQAVFPKAVNVHKFVYNQVKDEDGNVVSEDSIDDCLSLNSDQIYAALFGAVQKLMGDVESLQERVVKLEATP